MVVVAVASNAAEMQDQTPAFSTFNNIGNTAYSDNMNQWLSLLLMSGFVLALGMKKRLNK